MDALTQCETLLSQAHLGCAVMGSPSLDHFELIDPPAMTFDAAVNASARGLIFVGVVTITPDGAPKSAFVVNMPEDAVKALAELFAHRVTAELAARIEVAELERLYGKVDPRTGN